LSSLLLMIIIALILLIITLSLSSKTSFFSIENNLRNVFLILKFSLMHLRLMSVKNDCNDNSMFSLFDSKSIFFDFNSFRRHSIRCSFAKYQILRIVCATQTIHFTNQVIRYANCLRH
jgi:hypothetical protein